MPELLAVLADIAESLRVIAAQQPGPAAAPTESPKARAVRLLVEMGPKNISAVAKAVGVSRKTLYKWPETRTVMDRLRAVEVWQRRDPRAVTKEGVLL
jgi:hypothetical protein